MSRNSRAPLLVHIGYHKTATSFLQSRVFADPELFSQPWGAQSAQAVEWFILAHPQRFDAPEVRRDFLDRVPEGADHARIVAHLDTVMADRFAASNRRLEAQTGLDLEALGYFGRRGA